jgi:hypothetical protein
MSSASPYSLGDGASPSLNDTSHTPNYKNPASRKPQVFAVQLSMTCISFLFVALRIATKTSLMKSKRAFRLDDILIVFALVRFETDAECEANILGQTVSIVMTALCLIGNLREIQLLRVVIDRLQPLPEDMDCITGQSIINANMELFC